MLSHLWCGFVQEIATWKSLDLNIIPKFFKGDHNQAQTRQQGPSPPRRACEQRRLLFKQTRLAWKGSLRWDYSSGQYWNSGPGAWGGLTVLVECKSLAASVDGCCEGVMEEVWAAPGAPSYFIFVLAIPLVVLWIMYLWHWMIQYKPSFYIWKFNKKITINQWNPMVCILLNCKE